MKNKFLLIIIGISLNCSLLSLDATYPYLINRRIKPLRLLFISPQEIFQECERNSEPAYSLFEPGKQMPHGAWYYHQVGFGEIRELKGVSFSPSFWVVFKHSGDKIHLLCALLNEYWQKTGEVLARNVPYILTPHARIDEDTAGYFYEYREGHETSPPSGGYEYNPWLGYEGSGEIRNQPPFLAKLQKVGLNCYRDIVQSDDGRVGKHWIEGPNYNQETHEDGWLIDYDAIHIDYQKLKEYLEREEPRMREVLGYKYDLLIITFQLMQPVLKPSEKEIREREILENKFYQLFSQYQQEIWARILQERGINPP
ncbi:MAG: hypothetical protein AB7E08_06375 [Candidatus Omnitrophota bacterium]